MSINRLVDIAVEPWPQYANHGGAPIWTVRIETTKNRFTLSWYARLRRFCQNARRLNRNAPTAYREAVAFMTAFCEKSERLAGTTNPQRGQKNEREGQLQVGTPRARRNPTGGVPVVPVSLGTRDRDTKAWGQGQPFADATGRPHPQFEAPSKAQQTAEHKAKLAADPRFALWLAGCEQPVDKS